MSATVGNEIDLTGLLPKFDSISFFPQTADQLSAFFVFVLLLIFAGFALVSVYALLTSSIRISWVFKLLKDETPATVASNRQELIEKATKVKHHQGHLWLEFDETLIEVEGPDGIKLYNTIDANHFFNTSTLAAGITESRMLAAVPGFLTAFGVIGTFVGLQLGLSELNIGNGIAVSEMKTGVGHVISGAKIAFMTSVWGVTLSVLFNFFEKVLERIARGRIHRLQNKIDRLFPRLTAEYQLQRIANDGQQSRENLQGLAEKIGEKMQESLLDVTSGIQAGLEASLKNIMGPAIDKLVNETTDGNQKALENLINTFLNKIGKFGESQGEALEDAAQKIYDALGSFNLIMKDHAAKMETSQNNSANREQQLIKTISTEVSLLVDHSTEQKRVLTEFVEKQLGGLSATINEGNQAAKEREDQRGKMLVGQTDAIKASTEKLLSRIEDGLEQGERLQRSIDDTVKANASVVTSLDSSAKELRLAAQEIQQLGSHLESAGDNLSFTVTDAAKSTTDLAKQNQLSSELMEKMRSQLAEDKQHFMQTVGQLQSLLDSAETSFETMRLHQNSFLTDLQESVEELAEQMTKLLSDYASQANSQTKEHLDIWAKHTTDYAVQMKSAVQALANVVDDIENKIGR